MLWISRTLPAIALAGAVTLVPLAVTSSTIQPEETIFSVEEFRAHHEEIREHLDHIDEMVRNLVEQPPDRQRSAMRFIVNFLNEHILEHAKDEERTLYAVADRRVHARFTQTMRFEHTIVEKWIKELAAIQDQEEPDTAAFARRTQRLLGLLEAHFAAEEEVILPAVAQER